MTSSVSTPYLVVDKGVLERNVTAMAERCERAGVALRPHVKTHKIPHIAELQRRAGAVGITVATLSEAEVFAKAGYRDVFIAYPLWLDERGAERLRGLVESDAPASISLGVDSLEGARRLTQLLGSDVIGRLTVMIELDSGQHRCGLNPQDAGELAVGCQSLGLSVGGVFTFPGHSYGPDARLAAAESERDAVALACQALRRHGVEPLVRSGGSSPSMAYLTPNSGPDAMTEVRPGAYVFNDAQQWELGAAAPDDIALTAHATVVSHAGGRLIVNAGSKVLAPDKAPWASGFGRLLDHPDARIVQLSEHHAVIDLRGEPLPRLGSIVRLVPNHCCNAINLADAVRVHRNGSEVEVWPIAARGCNS